MFIQVMVYCLRLRRAGKSERRQYNMNRRITLLGKFLRKLRIDRGEFLREMSAKLNVTMSFLSAVENGKKAMPTHWIGAIPELYGLNGEQRTEFETAVAESEKGIDVKFDNLTEQEKVLSVAFARKIRGMSEEDRKILQGVLFGDCK